MTVFRPFWAAMALFFALMVCALPVSADKEALVEYVKKNTDDLVEKLNEERSLYRQDPEAFYTSVEQTLSEFMDFRRIAARVMGRYARQASPEQRDEFVRKFKRSLFDSYVKTLVDAEDFSISVLGAEMNPNNDGRARVNLRVETASGERYPVTYSMYKDDNGDWLMENVIAQGVNLGLAFRDRFSQEMEENRNNVQAVIDGWSDAVKDIDIEEEADKS